MKLMILDGNSIINRAYYGVRMLNAPDGTPTNGVYGFLSIFRKLFETEKPDAVCVAFDLKAPTFRHLQYPQYKAQRKGMPDELAVQMPVMKEVLDAMGVTRLELEGFEADDIIGTVSRICERAGWDCRIVTGDKDSFQLITDKSHVIHYKSHMGKTETKEYNPEVFFEEYGFSAPKIVDFKALMGDSSDNIPGVPGVGEKTAMELMHKYGSLNAIYADLSALDVKEGVRKKLENGKESAFLSYDLATIRTAVPIEFFPESCKWNEDYKPEIYSLFKRLGFNKFLEKWGIEEAPQTPAVANAVELERAENATLEELSTMLETSEIVAVAAFDELDRLEICDGKKLYDVRWTSLGDDYSRLLKLLFSERVKKVGHGVKALMSLLISEKLPVSGFCFDTELAAYLLDAREGSYPIERVTMRYLGCEMFGAEGVYALMPVLKSKLSELNMDELFYNIELPLCEVLADMEDEGFLVDKAALGEFGTSLSAEIDKLKTEIWDAAEGEFNINSPKQLGEVLFVRLGLPAGKKTKTGWSTNADVLEKLRDKHPIVNMIMDYRMLTKLKSTYADGLLKLIGADGRLHTSFQMTATATGRLSSTEPNLQNIPIRKELGARIRKMFIAPQGKLLVDADYSQIELRLLAHISGDRHMQEAFLEGDDIHRVTASQVFSVPLSEVTTLQRSRAKAVNFGIVYGISAWSLAQDIGVFPSEAKQYMDAYLEKYSGVRDYMKSIVEKAKRDGYVSTVYNRRRALPELSSSNFNMRSFGERVALNMPIQGTAADIIKLAMVNVYRRLKSEGLKSKLILQVHDELICECPENEAERVKLILSEEMENVAKLSVPLIVEAKSGHSWAEAH